MHGKTPPEIGDEMEDGTILAGYYEGRPLYTTPVDAVICRWLGVPLTYTFNQAKKYAAKLDAHDHQDWRVPTPGELGMLFENRNKGRMKGTFYEANNGLGSFDWYRSSSEDWDEYGDWGSAQHFSDGKKSFIGKGCLSSLRCVRG